MKVKFPTEPLCYKGLPFPLSDIVVSLTKKSIYFN